MNREILFRGKPIGNWEWVEGFVVINENGECFIKDTDYNVNNGKCDLIPARVDPETVGQYTGLKDKNGLRIFEGDIVEFKLQDADEYRFAKILYGEFIDENDSQFYLGFYVVGMGCTFSIFNGKDEGCDFIGMCEVAGNVHDSPELLVAE